MTKKNLSQLQKKYQDFFLEKLKSFGVSSPAKLSKENKSAFFTSIKQEWAIIKYSKKQTKSKLPKEPKVTKEISKHSLDGKTSNESVIKGEKDKKPKPILVFNFEKTNSEIEFNEETQKYNQPNVITINYIVQLVEYVFNKHRLVGNHDFSEDEYSIMVDFVGEYCKKYIFVRNHDFDKKSYKLIFFTLIEIAKRWKVSHDSVEENEEDIGFWGFIFKTLINEEFNEKLYIAFTGLISHMELQYKIHVVNIGNKYYATLMMHAYTPKYSIQSFYDLCYTIFKKDLDFGFTSDDEWICEKIATEMKIVLGGGYREDKKVTIGSGAYLIKIGLRSFALHEDLSVEFIEFIKHTFYQINKLFNRENIFEHSRLDQFIVEWWRNKSELEKLSDADTGKKKVATVTKQNIVAKYFISNNMVFLSVPRIRLDNHNDIMRLFVYVDGEQVFSEEMKTKRKEIGFETKEVEFEINDLLKRHNSINVRIEITENDIVIFDSESNKTTSLIREFILFDGEKEVFSQNNKPTNYFVYSKNIGALKSTPQELSTCGINLYNIYPSVDEKLIGEIKQVYFVNKEKVERLGNTPCLIGNLTDVEWRLDDISCVVYGNRVKLMIPESENLKALELRIDGKPYKLHNLNFERLENNSYQFGLKVLGLISESEPTEVSLYCYETETTLLKETIIVFPNLEIEFNNEIYYGDIERKVTMTNDKESIELSWSIQDKEVTCPLNDGVLLIKIPYLRWRINNKEWHNENIKRILWYKDLLENGDLIEIDNPKENEKISVFGITDGNYVEITKNQSGKYEIGRAVYTNENKKEICVSISNGKEKFKLFNVATKEQFIDIPLIYKNEKVYWDVENTFIGEKNNSFFLIMKGKRNDSVRVKIGHENKELDNIEEDKYKITVKIKDKSIFSKEDSYQPVFESDFLVGIPEKLRFRNKMLSITEVSAAFYEEKNNNWIQPFPAYVVRNLQYLEETEQGQIYGYYIGQLGLVKDNKITNLDFMENEKWQEDKINPVRLDFRSNNSFWLGVDYDKENTNNLDPLIFDIKGRSLCNINSRDTSIYKVVNLYKFREEEDV